MALAGEEKMIYVDSMSQKAAYIYDKARVLVAIDLELWLSSTHIHDRCQKIWTIIKDK